MTTMTEADRKPWRLGIRARRVVLIGHIASAGAWLGVDVAMGVLIFTAMLTGDAQTQASCLRVLALVTVWPLLVCGLTCLVTGVLLGVGSKWGLVRYWWVAVKLVLNVVLTALVLVLLQPEVSEQARRAGQALDGHPVPFDLSNLLFPPIVSPTMLLVAVVLSVVKPWGRLRR